jgi:hypothetical protein
MKGRINNPNFMKNGGAAAQMQVGMTGGKQLEAALKRAK